MLQGILRDLTKVPIIMQQHPMKVSDSNTFLNSLWATGYKFLIPGPLLSFPSQINVEANGEDTIVPPANAITSSSGDN